MIDDSTPKERAKSVLTSLADDDNRAILESTTSASRSVRELVERCQIPTATTYWKINHLVDIGLLWEEIGNRATGKNIRKYRLRVSAISVTIDGAEGIEFDSRLVRDSDGRLNDHTGDVPRVETGALTPDGGTETDVTSLDEFRQLGDLFIDITGTEVLVEEQDVEASSQAYLDEDSISISEYVAGMIDNDGLGETIDELEPGNLE